MKDLKFNSTGPDAVYLVNVNTLFSSIFTLDAFRNGWPEEKLGSQSVLQTAVDWYRQNFEGGRSGNRFQIAARRAARQDLDARIRKILAYLGVMADESDITRLVSSGVVTMKMQKKARRVVKPVPAT